MELVGGRSGYSGVSGCNTGVGKGLSKLQSWCSHDWEVALVGTTVMTVIIVCQIMLHSRCGPSSCSSFRAPAVPDVKQSTNYAPHNMVRASNFFLPSKRQQKHDTLASLGLTCQESGGRRAAGGLKRLAGVIHVLITSDKHVVGDHEARIMAVRHGMAVERLRRCGPWDTTARLDVRRTIACITGE